MTPELREKCTNTIRFLSADAVQKANSGHPGAPMGLADFAFVLWNQFLRYNPQDPQWTNRDRFVLSGGHGSMLLYSLLHLSGYDLSLEEIKQFRQWKSQTPGHPEYGLTSGVECTTGPLGAGFGNSVGMALGLKMSAARFNTADTAIIDSYVYTFCGDGDIQEGVLAESASFAGHLKLNNLIVIYDQNKITIGGDINLSMGEDVGKRFEAYGWHVQHCDGHNHNEIETCLTNAKGNYSQPSLIVASTIIGKGAPTKEGTAATHGNPLGDDEIKLAKEKANWPLEPAFFIPEEVKMVFKERSESNQKQYQEWQAKFDNWKQANPNLSQLWERQFNHTTPEDLLEKLVEALAGQEAATRKLSHATIQEAAKLIPSLIGGSADLEPSNLTLMKEEKSIVPSSVQSNSLPDPSFAGRNIHFGIREHGMGTISNGLYLAGGWIPYCATFLVFSDYMRASIRLAALSHIPTIFVFTHDSFWVGEDGPTHQPVEHISSLRLIPNLNVWRPADNTETAAAWAYAIQNSKGKSSSTGCPSALLFTRQGVKNLERRSNFDPKEIWKGGYIVQDSEQTPTEGRPEVILISTGSEGAEVQTVRANLENQGIATRHVSMICLERFQSQPKEYQDSILPKGVTTIAIETGSSALWYQYADYVIGKDDFGSSAPGKILSEKFGFTSELLTQNITNWLKNRAEGRPNV